MNIDAIVLAGGKIEDSLAEFSSAPTKAFIEIAGRPMVEYVIDALKGVSGIDRIALAADKKIVVGSVKARVDLIAAPGSTMIKSLRSAISALEPAPDMILILPCDLPLITSGAIQDFLDRSLEEPVDIAYGFLSEEDSVAKFPDVHHTYVKLNSGRYCGTGLFLMNPDIADSFEELINKASENRKNPLKLAGQLGLPFIVKYILGILPVSETEQRVGELLGGVIARGIQTRYAEAAFNVDAPNELMIARKILEKTNDDNLA